MKRVLIADRVPISEAVDLVYNHIISEEAVKSTVSKKTKTSDSAKEISSRNKGDSPKPKPDQNWELRNGG